MKSGKKHCKRYKIRKGSLIDIVLNTLIFAGVWAAVMAILVPLYNAACAGGAM